MKMIDEDNDTNDGGFAATTGNVSDAVSVTSEVTMNDGNSTERDEVLEIEKMSRKETARVRIWRLAVTGMLLVTAVVVTLITFYFLNREEYKIFVTAYEQFARTVADAALEQQYNVRDALIALSNTMSMVAATSNASWPYYYNPTFEYYAQDFRTLSRAEFVGFQNIVTPDQREQYMEWATKNHEDWIRLGHMQAYGDLSRLDQNRSRYIPYIARKVEGKWVPEIDSKPWWAVRTTQSPPARSFGAATNVNIASLPGNQAVMDAAFELHDNTHTKIKKFAAVPPDEHKGYHTDSEADNPHTFIHRAVYEEVLNTDSPIVADITATVAWDVSMLDLLPTNVKGIVCVIDNDCNQTFTYEIDGHDAYYRGAADVHDPKYEDMVVEVDLSVYSNPEFNTLPGHCRYKLRIYPSTVFQEIYTGSNTPEIYAALVASTFVMVAFVFFVYDVMVQRRNTKITMNAAKANGLVSSLFPMQIRERLMSAQRTGREQADNDNKSRVSIRSSKSLHKVLGLKGSGGGGSDDSVNGDSKAQRFDSKPLADLFLETSVMFADVAGFTAWSSVREPTQVFTLLESVYSEFDALAKRHRVFKVETIGDCYVAVAGLPEPRKDHAEAVARFATQCMIKLHALTKKLEVRLGPDTGDLSLRVGINSGPVTAGVLRGDRARFQLFGDTVNTAARMESTSRPGFIQLSQETADLLIKDGKESWIQRRQAKVVAKGKGDMQTYWLTYGGTTLTASSVAAGNRESADWGNAGTPRELNSGGAASSNMERTIRLIDWNVEMLLDLIKQILASRTTNNNKAFNNEATKGNNLRTKEIEQRIGSGGTIPLDEVQEIITLPKFDRKTARMQQDPSTVTVPPGVEAELRDYVTCVANLYRMNPFHNFDHASHVVMSVTKLMSRIVAPTDGVDLPGGGDDGETNSRNSRSTSAYYKQSIAAAYHDYTFGITSDPLTRFAAAFSALIHDVDHVGVPNTQLSTEQPKLASMYRGRSVAEQNSFDVSWSLLMDERFAQLRAAIYSNSTELQRFRNLVINAVMATDLGDKELKELRNARWDKAFKKDPEQPVSSTPVQEVATDPKNSRDAVNRKATIVIEHLIQASDVSHTMQHWHVYRKWNERLFMELYSAFKTGRATTNPAEFWYKGEIGFFDFYIIPLTRKLKECGVFGVSSDEFLNFALKNREEWESRGQEVVAEMLEKVEKQWESSPTTESGMMHGSSTATLPPYPAIKVAQQQQPPCLESSSDSDISC